MAERPVLELRIHGINNTKPADMLGLSEDNIEKFAGDALGSFWRPKSDDPNAPTQLEAYSWGGMARTSVGGKAGRIVGGLARIGWALLIPFGLVNVAYWSRKFDDGPTPGERSHRDGLRHGRGAASLRIAGLILTLLMAVSASTIALDLVAVQCYDPDSNQLLCTSLPSQLGFLGTISQTRRLAVLSLIPVALIIGLGLLSAATRVRYEEPDPSTPKALLQTADASQMRKAPWPILSTEAFWAHHDITKVTSRMHVAATAALVAGGTAFHVAFGRGRSCGSRDKYFSEACRAEVLRGDWHVKAELIVVVLALVILAITLAVTAIRADYAADVPRLSAQTTRFRKWIVHWGPALASALLFIGQAVLLSWDQPQPQPSQLLGVSFTPTWLLAVLLGFGLAGLLWRPSVRTRWWWLPTLLGLGFATLIMISGYANTIHWWWAAWAAAAALAMSVLLRVRHTTAKKNVGEVWGGSGPGVLLLVAIAFAMLLSSAVVTTAGDWLNGNRSAAALADGCPHSVRPTDPCPFDGVSPVGNPDLQVPLPYVWSGASLLPVIVGMLLVAAYAFRKTWRWQELPDDQQPMTDNTIRFAAVAQCAERFVAFLAILSTIAMIVTLMASVRGFVPADANWHSLNLTRFFESMLTVGMWALAGTGVLIIGLAVGGTVTGGGRPLGLVWDLICFLPRTGHPLAPPCYAERVVPELAHRSEAWFAKEGGGKLVLSAHSLGSVLAVAVILSARLNHVLAQTSFLSYGSQLRAYFGRIFPELLGPKVLGVPPCRSSRLKTPDPWCDERTSPLTWPESTDEPTSPVKPPESTEPDNSVLGRLNPSSPRWRSLWRRTDYLGFPVWSYTTDPNPIDIAAAQVIQVGYLYEIQTHGGYPLTDQYRDALDQLIELTPAQSPSSTT